MKRLVLVFAIFLGLSAYTSGGITGLYNTGVDENGAVLGFLATDTHYILASVPSGPSTSLAINQHSNWVTPNSGSCWIGPSNSNINDPSGSYIYRLTFNITDDVALSNVVLTGFWATDNSGEIHLNGETTGATKGFYGYASLASFSINRGFHTGQNTLDFIVNNGLNNSGPDNPTGLLVSDLNAAIIPEPATLLFLGVGVFSLFHRRQS